MKKKNTLGEKIRRKALKVTIVFMALCIVIEAVVFIAISLGTKSLGGLTFEETPVFIGIVLFDIVLSIAGYFDFKREIMNCEKDDENNEKN